MTPEQRIALLESRLAAVEARLGVAAPVPPSVAAPPPAAAPAGGWKAAAATVTPAMRGGLDVARVLGIGGVVALLLAASYLIRLALESGWLTPSRQIGLAAALGVAMIAGGIALLRQERRYASLLPAGGLAILYLCTYGAHFAYALIGPWIAGLAVMGLSLLALPLGRLLQTDVYALLSAVTSYSVPVLLPVLTQDPLGLALYFSAWGLLYSAYAIFVNRRAVYLVALYLGLILFAALPKLDAAWVSTVVFQTLQLVIFGAAAALFSIRTGRPMSSAEATAHAPALLIFYALQYSTLSTHVPELAPAAALASAAAVVAIFLAARKRLGESRMASLQLVAGYVALVAFHAGYLELLPAWAAPIIALVVAPVAAGLAFRRPQLGRDLWPLLMVAGLVYVLNVIDLLQFRSPGEASTQDRLMAGLFAAQLYAAYRVVRGEASRELANAMLYSAHVMALNTVLIVLDDPLWVAIGWAVLAIVTMGLGIRGRDRDLGRSALLILAFLAGKVLLYDLSGAEPVTRILVLLTLGITLYGSGLVYQRKLARGAPS
jgi:uncharacterized membrane protein